MKKKLRIRDNKL